MGMYNHRLEVLQANILRPFVQTHVPEALKGKMRLIFCGCAVGNIGDFLPGSAQVFRVKAPSGPSVSACDISNRAPLGSLVLKET